ncbi:uncharacterized protein LOC144142404 isoform X2 [Haemaphysalis longicornis]
MAMGRESEIAAQRRRRAEKLNSSDPEVVAWQLAVERRKNERKRAKRAAETPEQREERLAKRRRQDAERRARPSQQQQHTLPKMSGRRNMAARAGVISSRNVARRVTKAAVTTANKGEQCWLSRPRATQTPRTSLRSAACQTEIITYPGVKVNLLQTGVCCVSCCMACCQLFA